MTEVFGRHWESGEATIITSETGNHYAPYSDWGTVSARLYVVDVRPAAGGPMFRATVKQTYGEAEGAPNQKYRALESGDVVRVRLDAKRQKVKFDNSDPRRLKPRSDAPSAFDAAAAAAPGTPLERPAADGFDSRKLAAFAALAKQHGVHLKEQPEDVRTAIVSDFQASGVPVHPQTFSLQFTDGVQIDNAIEVLKRHGLLPPDAALRY